MAINRKPELDPQLTAFARSAISRRAALGGFAAVAASGFLAACGVAGKTPSASAGASKTPLAATDMSDTEKLVNWSNWPAYMDVSGGKHPTLDAFAKQTGIKVKYNEDYNDNDEFFAKVRPLLEAGKDTGRDTWCSTDWMVARLKRLGYIQPLDKTNIPNAANVAATLANVEFDPGRNYSLPWQSGFAGIAYNPKSTGGKAVSTIDQLLHDTALKGKVTLLTEMRDTIGLILMEQGVKLDSVTADQFAAALQVLSDAKNAGQIKGFTGNDYTKPLASGDTAACVAWTGDVVQLRLDNPNLGFVLPEKGFTLWSDNFVIPAMAQHKKNAEKLINYYYDPAVMAEVEAYVNYIAPVQGTKDAISKTDPSMASNDLIFPSEATLARAQVFRGLTAEEETSFTRQFQALVTG
jgi:spermidine/putrescine transport system substrate-binding protein